MIVLVIVLAIIIVVVVVVVVVVIVVILVVVVVVAVVRVTVIFSTPSLRSRPQFGSGPVKALWWPCDDPVAVL